MIKLGQGNDPIKASRISLYILSTQLGISPAEAYEMPYTLVRDLLLIHGIMKEEEAKQYEKVKKFG